MTPRGADEHTSSVEDYLKTIYALEREGSAAATNEIADRLSVAPASVTGMVRRLADQGLLEYERYRGARLTDEGRRVGGSGKDPPGSGWATLVPGWRRGKPSSRCGPSPIG